MRILLFLAVGVMTLLGALGAFFFKTGAPSSFGLFQLLKSPKLYLGGVLYVSAAVLNILLLRWMDYSVLYPMTAITYVWTLVLSSRLLGEKITSHKMMGVVLICIGVVLLML